MTGKQLRYLAEVLLLAGLPLGAQTTGSLAGTAEDPSGSLLPGCLVKVTETGSGAERNVSTGDHGRYLVPGLPPGLYRVEISRSGFRSEKREDIELPAGRTVRVDFRL